MTVTATQRDIDAVAHFIQAAKDLKASPIFTEEQCEIGVTYDERGVTYRVPDPRVRDAMVIPFRRIWMQREPAYFDRICNILDRCAPQWRPYIDLFKKSCQHARQKFDYLVKDDPGVAPEDVINMWLYCRLTHAGATGKFSRSDYERELSRLGQAKFEYLLLVACYNVGLSYINLLQIAEWVLLSKWASEGLKPSFVFDDDLAAHGTRDCKDGVWLERSTPGMTIAADDLAAQLNLLRRRRAFSGMNRLIGMVSVDINRCLHLLQTSSDVDEFLRLAGFAGDTIDHVSVMDGASNIASVSDDFTDIQQYPWRKGAIARFDLTIKMAGQSHQILEEQFVRLKEALFGKGQNGDDLSVRVNWPENS